MLEIRAAIVGTGEAAALAAGIEKALGGMVRTRADLRIA